MRITNNTAINLMISDIKDQPNVITASTYKDFADTDDLTQSYNSGDLRRLITAGTVSITSVLNTQDGVDASDILALQTSDATHAGLTTGVHGVGAGVIAKVADIAVNTNLSAGAQAAITASHGVNDVNTSSLAKLQVYLSGVSIGGGATETVTVPSLIATDTILSVVNSTVGANPAVSVVAGYGAPGAGTLSITWIGNPGAGAICSVLVKKL